MLSAKSLTAFIESINDLGLTGVNGISCNGGRKNALGEEKEQRLLESIFSFIETHRQTKSAEIIVRQFVILLQKHNLPVDEIADTSTRQETTSKTPENETLRSKLRSLVSSAFLETFKSLMFSTDTQHTDVLERCEMMANLRISAMVLPPSEIVTVYLTARKADLSEKLEINHSRIDSANNGHDLAHQVQSFHDFLQQAITSLERDAEIVSRVCPPGDNLKRQLEEMSKVCLDVLGLELEMITSSARQANISPSSQSSSPEGANFGATRFDSSHTRNANKRSLVHDDEGVHQSSGTLDKGTVELLVQLMADCAAVEERFWRRIDLADPRFRINREDDRKTRSEIESDDERYKFRWRPVFVPFMADIIPIMNLAICFDCFSAMDEEWEILRARGALTGSTVVVSTSLSTLTSYQLKSVALLCDALTRFDIRLTTSTDNSLAPVHTAFLLCVKQQCSEAANHVLKIARESTSCMDSVYILLNSTFRLEECVQRLAFRDAELQFLVDDISNTATTLLHQILDYHTNTLTICVLHDAESNDWSNAKPFYENERCSFSVQAWFNHMSALRHDLWQLLQPGDKETFDYAPSLQKLFVDVLESSLRTLASRYSSITPSCARLCQLQSDIIAILLSTSHLLVFASRDLESYQGMGDGNETVAKIHAHCSALLDVLIVVTSPFRKLYKMYKKVFPANSCNAEDVSSSSSYCQRQRVNLRWLSQIIPSVWKSIERSPLSPGSWIIMHLKIFVQQPARNYGVLLKVLVGRDAILGRLIVAAYPDITMCSQDSQSVGTVTESTGEEQSVRTNPVRTAAIISVNPRGEDCVKCVLYVLAQMTSSPHCLAAVFLHVFDGELDAFEFKALSPENVPLWLQVLTQSMRGFLVDLRETFFVHFLQYVELKDSDLTGLTDMLRETISVEIPNNGSLNSCELVSDALLEMLSSLRFKLHTIPLPVCILLASLAERDETKFRSFKVIVAALNECFQDLVLRESESQIVDANTFALVNKSLVYLLDPPTISEAISPEFKRCLARVDSDVVRISRIIGTFVESCNSNDKQNWQSENEEVDDINDGISADLSLLLSTKDGLESLKTVDWFVRNHMNWLENRLCINEEPCMRLPEIRPEPNESKCPQKPFTPRAFGFNPFANSKTIGSTGFSFQQSSLTKMLNWDKLLLGQFPSSKLAFSILLSHRWEFQSEARLDEYQRKYVTVLRQKYCSESRN